VSKKFILDRKNLWCKYWKKNGKLYYVM